MGKLKVLIGSDPELWVRDKRTGLIVSAHNLIPGTKTEPFKVNKGAIQVDGVAAEFNTDPAADVNTFISNLQTVQGELQTKLGGNYELVSQPTAVFEKGYWDSLPEATKELGCNPDFNAWTGEVNPAPNGESTTMRTASGHIHIGWEENVNPQDPMHFEDCRTVVKQLDYYLGVYSVLWDPDNTRRQLYGKAGAFRPKPYGVEYRTMSNVWLRSPKLQAWVFQSAVKALNDLLNPDRKRLEDQFGELALEVINEGKTDWIDNKKAQTIHQYTGLSWPDYKSVVSPAKVPEKKTEIKLNSTSKDWLDTEGYQKIMKAKHMYETLEPFDQFAGLTGTNN